jgi:hypothetical protein
MRREVWTKEKLWLLKDYVKNGFSERHIEFMLDINAEQLRDGMSRLDGVPETEGGK